MSRTPADSSLDARVARAINSLRPALCSGGRDFVGGDCHSLAIALYLADERRGSLLACIKEGFDGDAAPYIRQFSHMVYATPSGACLDIGGVEADVRWEEYLDLTDTPDKWGLVYRVRWEGVEYERAPEWLARAGVGYDADLIETLTGALRAELQRQIDRAARPRR